jgi:ornithine cyclodeaminase/alanine dehydrogenase-like protein (mu-crystallin family)
MPISGGATSPSVVLGPWPAACVRVRERGSVPVPVAGDVVAAGGLDVAATIDVVEEALRPRAEGDTRLPAVGLAIEDVAAAARVYRRVEELGLGTELSLWRKPIWT